MQKETRESDITSTMIIILVFLFIPISTLLYTIPIMMENFISSMINKIKKKVTVILKEN